MEAVLSGKSNNPRGPLKNSSDEGVEALIAAVAALVFPVFADVLNQVLDGVNFLARQQAPAGDLKSPRQHLRQLLCEIGLLLVGVPHQGARARA